MTNRGRHIADIERLLECPNRLVESGHSVIMIARNLDLIKSADHVIVPGPDGGHKGGRIMAIGTPKEVAAVPESHTGRFL
ncbi:hypothetical protein SCOR_00250 [Sulfidibacter corallicola]|uniref:UvrABC system protein A n=1 Tax=Sulfidibacter corallicola TaxID=2818388 RepID=A0A8A4TIM7_SULCO|nr:hypothetical protein [Sulfidibacter corallicola]QTD49044.1 hypothetical protein J3U87_25950 [Sulfidibacter corallicola]